VIFRIHPDSGVPIYLQLVRQVIHATETGALRPGDQLPAIRTVAEEAVTNPNTVAKAYRELEYEGVIELRQGLGAFVCSKPLPSAQTRTIRGFHAPRF
jgi:GntR family transcriptional regulator